MRLQLLILLLALAAAAHADNWNKTYRVTGKPSVYVHAGDGNLNVSSNSAQEVSIRVTTEGYRLGPGEVTIEESQTGNDVHFELRIPHGWHFGFGNHRIDIDITVPQQASLDLNTSDGHIHANDLSGDFKFRTGDGSMELRGLDGTLVASSGDGHINADGRFDDLDVHTGDGHIELDARRGSKISTEWRVKSGDGRVRVRIPSDLAADLDVTSGDGSIDVDFPLTVQGGRMKRQHVHGKLNGGGQLLEVRTGDGSITVSPL